MPATTKTPLGASTVVTKWYVDIDVNDGVGTASWLPVLGLTNFTLNPDAGHLEDSSDYDSGGFQAQDKTATAWTATGTLVRKVTAADATAYDPGQEHLRNRSIGKIGQNSVVYIRVYEMTPSGPRVEAYSGHATVSWEPQGGPMTALDTVNVTLTGQGQLAQISHPDSGSAVPTISGLTLPSGVTATTLPAAGGTAVRILGNHFTGTTGITFAGTAATSFAVVSDGEIVATAPAHTAGSGNLVVTNGAGASSGFAIAFV